MSSPKGRKSRKAIADEAEGQARRLAWIEAGVPIRDDKPFLDPAGTRPIGAVLASLRPTAPPPPSASKPATAPKAQPSNLPKSPAARAKRGKQAVEATPSASAEPAASEVEVEAEEAEAELPTAASVAFVAVLMASLSLLLGLLVPSSRRRQPASGRAPLALRLSFPFVGAGLALCLFALGEVVLRILGAASYGWALVIPLGLVGLGTGRLWVDVVSPDVLSRRLPFLLIAVTGWLLAVLFLAPTLSAQVTAPLTARWLVAGLSLLLSGAALGLPLAAGLALVGRVDPNPVAWCWAAHLGGWAFGGALAAWLVTELGLAKLWPLGLALFVVGAALLVSGGRRIRSGAAVPAAAPGAGTSSAGLAAPAAQ